VCIESLCGLFWGAPRRRIRGRGTHKSVTINGVKINERRVKTDAPVRRLGAPQKRLHREARRREGREGREENIIKMYIFK
jgi:hypothetical protein